VSNSAAHARTTQSFLPYGNLKRGIALEYPQDWEHQENNDPFVFSLCFAAPPVRGPNQFRENLTVTVQPLLDPIALEEFARGRAEQQRQLGVPIEGPVAATLAGLPAYQMSSTGPLDPMGQFIAKILALCTIKNGKVYILSYTAEAAMFDRYLPEIQRMIQSFTIAR
jgi:hypothetical protein